MLIGCEQGGRARHDDYTVLLVSSNWLVSWTCVINQAITPSLCCSWAVRNHDLSVGGLLESVVAAAHIAQPAKPLGLRYISIKTYFGLIF